MPDSLALPSHIRVLERGWLSSNNVLIQSGDQSALIDSGYYLHAEQTVALLAAALPQSPLDVLVNTHLHSDHCGGNAALQAAYGQLQTHIPPGHWAQVRDWDTQALGYVAAGQECPRFTAQQCLPVGGTLQLGGMDWQVHAAPGHDPHAVVLFAPDSATLVSGDALWERGFGVVFPELAGSAAFDAVAATLDRIEALQPRWVIPGHGRPFTAVGLALDAARARLDAFACDPAKHRRHAVKVLVMFRMLQASRMTRDALVAWCVATPLMGALLADTAVPKALDDVASRLDGVLHDLQQSGSVRLDADMVYVR